MSRYTPPDIISIDGLVDTYLRWSCLDKKGDRKYYSYHPSEWGKCLRYQQYKRYTQLGYIEVEEVPHESRILRIFEVGHYMHERWQNYFDYIGVLRGRWKCRNTLCKLFDDTGKMNYSEEKAKELVNKFDTRIYGDEEQKGIFRPEKCICGCHRFQYLETHVRDEELNFKGNADLILDFSTIDENKFEGVRKTFNISKFPKNPIVVDMKTVNDRGFDEMVKRGTKSYYITQIKIYIHILDCEYGLLWHENKNDCNTYIEKVERDDKFFEKVKWQANMMNKMVEMRRLPPPLPEKKTSYDCKNCDFKPLCHKSNVWNDPKLAEKRKIFYDSYLIPE